jgi:putative glutamine amidotransferase
MPKIRVFIVLFTIFFIQDLYSFTAKDPEQKAKILLVNPGQFYIRSMDHLVGIGVIDTSRIQFNAIYYEASEISIAGADEYIRENNLTYIRTSEIQCSLVKDDIFLINDCSEQFSDMFKRSDGIIFFGGWDIPPAIYGQKANLLTDIITPNRHIFEVSFLFHLLGSTRNNKHVAFLETKPDYLVFGICLGMQSMNVAAGGDMYQDIPSDIYGLKYVEEVITLDPDKMHRNYNKNLYPEKGINNHSFHPINIMNEALRNDLKISSGFFPVVVSSHHQAIKNQGKDIIVAATSMDGKVPEMILHAKYPNVIGTQFHPEFYMIYDPDSDKFRINPYDQNPMTEHEMLLKHDSYAFHLDLWSYILAKAIAQEIQPRK